MEQQPATSFTSEDSATLLSRIRSISDAYREPRQSDPDSYDPRDPELVELAGKMTHLANQKLTDTHRQFIDELNDLVNADGAVHPYVKQGLSNSLWSLQRAALRDRRMKNP